MIHEFDTETGKLLHEKKAVPNVDANDFHVEFIGR
jgi:hypothetical protein